jgi:hypothetical protein
MFDPLDILLAILALLAIVASTTALFSPFIAYLWYQRSELRGAKAEDLPGFPVIDPHPVDSTPVVSDAPRADNPAHVYPLREFLAASSDPGECPLTTRGRLPDVPGSDPDGEKSLGRATGEHAAERGRQLV